MANDPRSWKRDFKGIWIPKEIWFLEELSHMERILFAEIDSLDNERGCIASNEYVEFDGRRRVIHSLLEYGRADQTKLSGDSGQNCPPYADKNDRPYIIDKKGDKKGNTKHPSHKDRADKTDLSDIRELEKRGWNK